MDISIKHNSLKGKKPMKTQLFAKQQLQQVLKDLRKAGYTVVASNGRYDAFIDSGDETPVLTALNGSRAYLVRYNPLLLTAVA